MARSHYLQVAYVSFAPRDTVNSIVNGRVHVVNFVFQQKMVKNSLTVRAAPDELSVAPQPFFGFCLPQSVHVLLDANPWRRGDVILPLSATLHSLRWPHNEKHIGHHRGLELMCSYFHRPGKMIFPVLEL